MSERTGQRAVHPAGSKTKFSFYSRVTRDKKANIKSKRQSSSSKTGKISR